MRAQWLNNDAAGSNVYHARSVRVKKTKSGEGKKGKRPFLWGRGGGKTHKNKEKIFKNKT